MGRLAINGRGKLPPSEFQATDCLYRRYRLTEMINDRIDANSIRLPDLSCNWGRFSEPSDVLLTQNANPNDGCYSITVEVVRFNSFANAFHDPLQQPEENYSHVEVRTFSDLQVVDFNVELPKNQKKPSKMSRFAWRSNIADKLKIEIYAQ